MSQWTYGVKLSYLIMTNTHLDETLFITIKQKLTELILELNLNKNIEKNGNYRKINYYFFFFCVR